MDADKSINFATWDWLPKAAAEMEAYVIRLLDENSIKPHDVSARAKSIGSFLLKQAAKKYHDPMRETTDIVAIRIITYSKTDRERATELLRGRFLIMPGEDRKPGDEKAAKDERLRGYDCNHIVVTAEDPTSETDWLVAGGNLARYFAEFGGLEIQIRTVAGHAWAEFEHARRYKGPLYREISEQDQGTIDQLFGAASDARRALDETFVAIDRILARPSTTDKPEGRADADFPDPPATAVGSDLDVASLAELLKARFPNDELPSTKGMDFGIDVIRASGLHSVEGLEVALDEVDSEQVVRLMDRTVPVTRIRSLDDELLARFGERYIARTKNVGSSPNRERQLEWRFDRLRGKAQYSAYFILGKDLPPDIESGPSPAARTVRALASLTATLSGTEAALITGAISDTNDLLPSVRAREVPVDGSASLWVATNLSREASEDLMRRLLARVEGHDLRVMRDEVVVAQSTEA